MILDKAINQGTTDANATSKLSSADSNAVISAVNELIPDIWAALNALVAKKAKLAADGLTSTIQSDLATLKKDTDSFAEALIAIASSDTVSKGKSSQATIDAAFQSAINSFAS
jgi:hypothetical protein